MMMTIGTFSFVRRVGVAEEVFMQAMSETVLPAVATPGLNRADNVTRHEFRREQTPGQIGTYQWVIFWSGVGNVNRVATGCETMYDSVRDKLEELGTRTGFNVTTIEAAWDV